jgi:hypothetical protein
MAPLRRGPYDGATHAGERGRARNDAPGLGTDRQCLAFSGGRQGFNWSWIKGRTPDETDLPRLFRSVARVYMRGSTASTPSNVQPHAYVCVGFRDHIVQRMEFDDHENHQKSWNDTDDCAC